MSRPLLFNCGHVPLEQTISQRNMDFIPTTVSRFVSGNRQDRCPPAIEGIQHSQGIATSLRPQFAHFRKPRRLHLRTEGEAEVRPTFNEKLNPGIDLALFHLGQTVPPAFKLFGVFYFPGHVLSIASMQYRSYPISNDSEGESTVKLGAQRALFGFDRPREISMKSAQEIAETAKAWGQNDDITVATVRRAEC